MSQCKRCQRGEPHEFRHGTENGRRYHGCECEVCWRSECDRRRDRYRKRVTDPEVQQRDRDRARRWRLQNPERFREDQAQRYARDAQYCSAKMKRWAQQQPRQAEAYRPWTSSEDAIALRHDLSITERAYILSRSYGSVQGRVQRLRTGMKGRTCWSAEEDALLIQGNVTSPKLAAQLGRSLQAIYKRRSVLRRVADVQAPPRARPIVGSYPRRPRRTPRCHPDRAHKALGLCNACYLQQWEAGPPRERVA